VLKYKFIEDVIAIYVAMFCKLIRTTLLKKLATVRTYSMTVADTEGAQGAHALPPSPQPLGMND